MINIKTYCLDKSKRKKVLDMIISTLTKKKEIIMAYVHGSFLDDDFRDVDLALYLGNIRNKKEVLEYELTLERELEDLIGLPFDVRIINNAPVTFRFNVIKNGVLLLEKDVDIRSEFEFRTITEYHDFNYIREMYLREGLGLEI